VSVVSTDDERWRRLSPLSPLVRLGRGGLAALIIVLPGLLAGRSGTGANLAVYGAIVSVGVVAGIISWRVTRWRVYDGALQKEEGLLRRQSLRFPLGQIQAVDVLRPALGRILGLAELRLRMGGGSQSTGRLAYLPTAEALALRTRLLARHDEETAAEAKPEQPARILFKVSTPRLLGSLVLDLGSFTLLAVAIVIVVFVGPGAILIWILPALVGVWRRISAEYGRTVSEVGDGLHIEGGFVSTSAETIPRGRVQALKLTEPILWRPFGWCRLQVDLAGHQGRDADAGDTTGRSARSLIPVGTRSEADELVRYLLPNMPAERRRPPARARWKSPLSYPHLAWGVNDAVLVATAGRLARITSWVPLDKVQSLRRVRGPVQQRLRLETIHVDTAGRGVRAALRDRDEREGDDALRELVILCRRARVA
jgi:putative membrane protein